MGADIVQILHSTKILPMEYEYWQNIGLVLEIFAVSCHYCKNILYIGDICTEMSILHRNINFTLEISEIKWWNNFHTLVQYCREFVSLWYRPTSFLEFKSSRKLPRLCDFLTISVLKKKVIYWYNNETVLLPTFCLQFGQMIEVIPISFEFFQRYVWYRTENPDPLFMFQNSDFSGFQNILKFTRF